MTQDPDRPASAPDDVDQQRQDPQEEAADRAPQEAAAPGDAGVDATTPVSGDADASATDAEDEVSKQLEAAKQALAERTADLQRLQAEYVNYKRRVDRDRELVQQNALFSVMSSLLPVLDDLDRAREHGELEGGFKAVADSLERIVAGQGLTKFGTVGEEFDPQFHDALMHRHSAEAQTTTCEAIIESGYRIGDRVVRAARVAVVDPEPEGQPGSSDTAATVEAGEATPAAEAAEAGPAHETPDAPEPAQERQPHGAAQPADGRQAPESATEPE